MFKNHLYSFHGLWNVAQVVNHISIPFKKIHPHFNESFTQSENRSGTQDFFSFTTITCARIFFLAKTIAIYFFLLDIFVCHNRGEYFRLYIPVYVYIAIRWRKSFLIWNILSICNNAARLQPCRMWKSFCHVFRLVSFCVYFHFNLSDLIF